METAMTVSEAKALKARDVLHHVRERNADGTPKRFRVTSVKTWKTRPDQIEVRVSRGMYEHYVLTQDHLYQFTTDNEPSGNGVSGHWFLTKEQFESQRL
jgi:hypothetical protein